MVAERQAIKPPITLHAPQGAVIELSVRAAPLSALDASPELLQSGYWAAFKQAHGWQAHPFVVADGRIKFPLLVLTRRIARVLRLAYVPFGPTHDPGAVRGAFLADLSRALWPHLPDGMFLLRFDLPWEKSGELPADSARHWTTSNHVKLAEKRGVTVETGSAADMDRW